MIRKYIISIVLFLFVFDSVCLQADQEADKVTTKRFAIAVGANNGGPNRVLLKYAVSDAESIIRVFEEMGGVASKDRVLLANPNRNTFFSELEKLREKIKKSKAEHSRIEVIFYYSGHSDEEHILLSREKIPYKEIKDAINNIDADVRIAILDSCASGAFTRLKGGKKHQPFLMDRAYNMKGYAAMTSSSSDEGSQESDWLKGSFFTHYLISGMRGAADMTQDGRVTLNEAYQFAFNETLVQTTKTINGPQHPNYNIQMSGTGDVVMTDIRKSSAVLIIDKYISGKIFIHDQENTLVVELTKPLGREIELGLDEGEYRVINIIENDVYESKVALQKGESFELQADEFVKTDRIYTTSRGNISDQSNKDIFQRDKIKTPSLSRNSFCLKLSYWHNPKSENIIDSTGFIIESGNGGLSGKIGYSYYYNEKFAINLSVSLFQSKATIKGVTLESSTIIPVLLGISYYLRKFSDKLPIKPYLFGATGISVGSESNIATISINDHTESAFMIYIGAGFDFVLGSLIKLTSEIGYNLATDFSEPIGGRKNYSGPEFSIGLGFMF